MEDASCTAEIVWDLMDARSRVAPTIEIAEALYVGLVTDTGKFMYENTGPRAHVMAAELIAAGIDVHGIYRRLYEGMPYAKLELLGRALGEPRARRRRRAHASRYLDRDDFRLAGAEESYSEGIIDHLRSVEGTKVAALARELFDGDGSAQEGLAALDGRRDRRLGRSRAPAAAAATATRPASRPSSSHDELVAFLREQVAAQLQCPRPASVCTRWTDSSSSTSRRARPRTT